MVRSLGSRIEPPLHLFGPVASRPQTIVMPHWDVRFPASLRPTIRPQTRPWQSKRCRTRPLMIHVPLTGDAARLPRFITGSEAAASRHAAIHRPQIPFIFAGSSAMTHPLADALVSRWLRNSARPRRFRVFSIKPLTPHLAAALVVLLTLQRRFGDGGHTRQSTFPAPQPRSLPRTDPGSFVHGLRRARRRVWCARHAGQRRSGSAPTHTLHRA